MDRILASHMSNETQGNLTKSSRCVFRCMASSGRITFEQFAKQFLDLESCRRQGVAALRRDFVHPPPALPGTLFVGNQITFFLQPVQHRVQRPCAYGVTVTSQLFDDAETEDVFLGRVMQYVEADQSAVEVFVGHAPRLKVRYSTAILPHRCRRQPAMVAVSRTSVRRRPPVPARSPAADGSRWSIPAGRARPAEGLPRPH